MPPTMYRLLLLFKMRNKINLLVFLLLSFPGIAQHVDSVPQKFPVVLDGDSLFFLQNGVGVFSAQQRAEEISRRLNNFSRATDKNFDSLRIVTEGNHLLIALNTDPIMDVYPADAEAKGMTLDSLAGNYKTVLAKNLKSVSRAYGKDALINSALISLVYLLLLSLFFWLTTKLFPWLYKKIADYELVKINSVKVKTTEIISASSLTKALLFSLKLIRFAISLWVIYLFLSGTLRLWLHTKKLMLQPLLESFMLLVFYSAMFLAIIQGISFAKRSVNRKLDQWKGTKIQSLAIKSLEILPADRTVSFLKVILKLGASFFAVLFFYLYITLAFSLFSFSKTWANTLVSYILTPIKSITSSFVNFLPNLFSIVVLVVVFFYAIKAIKFIFIEIDKGTLEFTGFHKDWAITTYKIVRFLLLVLAAIVIFPYLPGSNSPFFQGISVFLGVLFSFGSSSAIGNIVSGIVLTYMRPFKLNDRVKIADTTGDVIEKTLLVTRIRTIKNVDVTIPNAMVLGSHIINYSSSAKEKGLILNTSVTIGYDVPWRKVHELLLEAAGETEGVLKDPKPFVLQTALNDFYVSYELNAYTNDSQKMAVIYSELHTKIQDAFFKAGVEIMSPHYNAVRDGNQAAIPQENLPAGYQVPGFRFFGMNFFGNEGKKD